MRFLILVRIRVLIAIVFLFCFPSLRVAQQDRKLEYAILVDSTGSMRSQFATVGKLAKAITHQVHDHGPISIYSFDSEGLGRGSRAVPASRVDREQDEELLDQTIDQIYVQGGQTTLLDAIKFMADRMNRAPLADKKIIVVITDGEDRVSEISRAELIKQLVANKTQVYAIGLTKELSSGKRSKATDLLKSLAKETTGRAVFPKSVDAESILTELGIPIR